MFMYICLLFVYRRPVAVRVKDIGVWIQIMESIGRISVVTNVMLNHNNLKGDGRVHPPTPNNEQICHPPFKFFQ
jgi:hypothetical protein